MNFLLELLKSLLITYCIKEIIFLIIRSHGIICMRRSTGSAYFNFFNCLACYFILWFVRRFLENIFFKFSFILNQIIELLREAHEFRFFSHITLIVNGNLSFQHFILNFKNLNYLELCLLHNLNSIGNCLLHFYR